MQHWRYYADGPEVVPKPEKSRDNPSLDLKDVYRAHLGPGDNRGCNHDSSATHRQKFTFHKLLSRMTERLFRPNLAGPTRDSNNLILYNNIFMFVWWGCHFPTTSTTIQWSSSEAVKHTITDDRSGMTDHLPCWSATGAATLSHCDQSMWQFHCHSAKFGPIVVATLFLPYYCALAMFFLCFWQIKLK